FLIAFSVFVLKQFFPQGDQALNIMNNAILFWTGVVLVIYTYETYNLRKVAQEQVQAAQNQVDVGQKQVEETQRQIEIQQRRFVIFEVIISDENRNRVIPTLKNIGNGIALNVRMREEIIVKELPIIDGERWGEYVDAYSCIYSSGEHIIKKDETISLEYGRWQILPINQAFPMPVVRFSLLYTQDSKRYYRTRIEFQNIDMDWYYVEQETNPEGLFIRKSGRLSENVS